MSKVRAEQYTNRLGTGAPEIPYGVTVPEGASIDGAGGLNLTGIATAGTFKGSIEATTASFSGNVSIAGTLTYEDVTNIDAVGLITARGGIEITGNIGLGGSTYGSSGQGLTSGGSGANATWSSIEAAPTASGVVSGSIGVGTAVAVQADGKFVTVTGTNAFNGNTTVLETQGYQHVDMSYAPDVDKVILKYVNSGDGKTYVKIGTPSADGKTVTWAAGTQPNGGSASGYSSMCYDTINNKVVVLFRDEGSRIDSVVGTISGTTINWGTIVNVDAGTGHWGCGISFDSSTGKCIGAWYQNSSSYELSVGTVSGTSITWGSTATSNSGDPQLYPHIAAENGHFVLAGRSYYHVGSYSGTTITMAGGAGGEQPIPFGSGNTTHSRLAVDSATSTYIMGGCKDGAGGGAMPSVFGATRSGTTLTFTDEQVLMQNGSQNIAVCYAGAAKKFFCLFDHATDQDVYSTIIQIVGTTISMTDKYKFSTQSSSSLNASSGVYNPDKGAVVAVWRNTGASGHGYYYVEGIRNSNGTRGGFVGFSNAAYTNGQTAKVSITGAISTNQSGLTVAGAYYLKGDGTIAMSQGAGDFLVGNALSSTNLLLR